MGAIRPDLRLQHEQQEEKTAEFWRKLPLYGLAATVVLLIGSVGKRIVRKFILKIENETSQKASEMNAAEMAQDPEVLRGVAESRAAYEQQRTLTLDQALPRLAKKERARA